MNALSSFLCGGFCGWHGGDDTLMADGVRRNFLSKYTLGKKIGEGGYAVVKLCYRIEDNMTFAVKIGKRDSMNKDDVNTLKKEFELVSRLDHPNILRVHELFEEKKHFYVVMDFIEGGELFDRIALRKQYTESDARDAAVCVLEGIAYFHSKNIVHRDLKPENLLMASQQDDTSIKIADFGLARRALGETLTERSGTPNYVSPEMVVGKPYGKPADMWAFGVILYIMLGGYPPFQEENMKALFKKISRADFKFHKQRWSNISEEARDLIRKILVVDTDVRLTAAQALQHPWMKTLKSTLSSHSLVSTVSSLKKFNALRRLRAVVRTVIVANRLKNSLDSASRDEENAVLIDADSEKLDAAPPSSLSAVRAAGLYSMKGPFKIDDDDNNGLLQVMHEVNDEDESISYKEREGPDGDDSKRI